MRCNPQAAPLAIESQPSFIECALPWRTYEKTLGAIRTSTSPGAVPHEFAGLLRTTGANRASICPTFGLFFSSVMSPRLHAWSAPFGTDPGSVGNLSRFARYAQLQLSDARGSLRNQMNKPCCCDEACESVETTTNLFAACTWRVEPQVAFCENSGKLDPLGSAHQQVTVLSGSVNKFSAPFSILLHRISPSRACSSITGLTICWPTCFCSRCRLRITRRNPDHLFARQV